MFFRTRMHSYPVVPDLWLLLKLPLAPLLEASAWPGGLLLPTSNHGVAVSNPAEGEILPEPNRRFIAQSLSCSPFHRLEMTEILLKGRKTLTRPSILIGRLWQDCADG